jgi:hypothetical protein
MEKYLNQLIADIQSAYKHKGVSVYPKSEYNPDLTTTMVQLTGIAQNVFPPAEQLSESQLQRLSEELKAVIESYNYILNLPKRLPPSMVYEKLLSRWGTDIPCIYDGLSAEGWEFCEDPETCGMHVWCDWLFCEVDPATIPVYNGIYDDNGNKIDLLNIPTPDLCLTCADYLTDNILCDLARADSIEEGEEFMCYAWRKRKD